MKSHIKEFIGVLAFMLFSVVCGYAVANIKTSALGGISQTIGHFASIGQYGTSTAVVVTSSGVQTIATSSSREYAEITNISGQTVWCAADADKAAVIGSGISILASTTKVFGQDFAYTGAVRCVSVSNATVTVYARQ